MAHKRIRPFNTRDTYPEQKLDNDLAQAVVARGTMVFLRGQVGQDLAGQPMVLLNAPPSRDYFLSILTDAGIAPRVAFRSTSFEMVRGMVGHGLGYALLATKPASGMTYDGRALVTWPLKSAAGASRVVLAYRRGAKLSGPAEEFAWLCRDFFGIDLD